jgi:hypothetical protein
MPMVCGKIGLKGSSVKGNLVSSLAYKSSL